MKYKIRSRKLEQDFEFWAPDNGGHIFLESPGAEGTLGGQICESNGNTIKSCGVEEFFIADCNKWYKRHIKNN